MAERTNPRTSPAASVAWAVATIVVALVVGALVWTGMQGEDSTPSQATSSSAGPDDVSTPTVEPGPSGSDEAGTADEAQQTLTPEQEDYLLGLARREEGDPTALGDVDADVVLLEFADYRCPYCARFSVEVQPELEDLIDDGTLRIEVRDTPIFGEDSVAAAVAARAAGEQGRFWEFHDAIFAAFPPEGGHPPMPRETLIGFAEEAGVPDLEQFESDLDSPELEAAVQADKEVADQLGVRSTPTFIVGTTPVIGAQPLEVFQETIEQEVQRADG